MLEKVKIKLVALGILGSKDDTSQDEVLELMIHDATDAVLAYCHRATLPDALSGVVRGLVVRTAQSEGSENVTSIKRGDTQISYAQTISRDSFTAPEIHILNCYRRLRIG